MVTLLARWCIKQYRDTDNPAVRLAYGVLCGAVGIGLNLLLFVGKFIAGSIAGSIAITADAFNNLSDAGSSVVTLIGFKMAGAPADDDHPFGHGRMEYLSAMGVAVLIIVMAVMTGFTAEFKNKLIETQSHFQIRKPDMAMNPLECRLALRQIAACGAEGTPVIQGPVLVQFGPKNRRLDTRAMLFAAPEAALKKRLHLERHLRRGELRLGRKNWNDKAHYAVISDDMALRWQLKVGEKFLVHSAAHLTGLVKFNAAGGVELNQESSSYLPAEFTVAGIYSMGKSDFDRLVFFVDPDDAADLFDLPWGAATGIYGWGPDAFDQRLLLERLADALPGFSVVGWEEANRNFLEVLAVEKTMMFFLLIFIVLVAAFSITNTLITSVYQKTREIGLLKAIGGTDGAILRIFVLQGFLVGLIGSVAGTLAGWLIVSHRQRIVGFVSRLTGQDLFPKRFYFFDALPAQLVPRDILIIIVCSILLCTAGALLPALRAARLQPAEALRYE